MFKIPFKPVCSTKKIFLNVIKASGFPELKLEKNVDFEKLYQQRLN